MVLTFSIHISQIYLTKGLKFCPSQGLLFRSWSQNKVFPTSHTHTFTFEWCGTYFYRLNLIFPAWQQIVTFWSEFTDSKLLSDDWSYFPKRLKLVCPALLCKKACTPVYYCSSPIWIPIGQDVANEASPRSFSFLWIRPERERGGHCEIYICSFSKHLSFLPSLCFCSKGSTWCLTL